MGETVLAPFTRFVHPSSVFTRAPSFDSFIHESWGLPRIGKCNFLCYQDIAKVLGVSQATVSAARKRYAQKRHDHILDLVKEEPRLGRPIKLDSKVEAKVTMIACSDPPQGSARWTLHLIADKLVNLDVVDSTSHESVRSLKKKQT